MYQKLLTKENVKTLPPLYSQENVPSKDKVAYVHFFSTRNGWDWYATEGSYVCPCHGFVDCTETPKEQWKAFLFFGIVKGYETEWGYFSLDELEKGSAQRHGFGVERDMYFSPKLVGEIERLKGQL